MDFVSTSLVNLTQPRGFWPSILNAFKSGVGTYIVAVILVAILVRILFSAVDIINKKVNMKNMDLNAKMKPELDAIQKRYGNDQRVLQQKQSEIYKKYQFSMMGSCVPMLITMILQFTVFLTLWNSLQAIANYNISYQYENMKYLYTNVIMLNDDEGTNPQATTLKGYIDAAKTANAEYDMEADLVEIDGVKKLQITFVCNDLGENQKLDFDYEDFSGEERISNQEIFEILNKYVIKKAEEPTPGEGEESGITALEFNTDTGYNEIFKALAEKTSKQYFQKTQEKFLWIKNIYRPESTTNPMFTKGEITKYLNTYYSKEEKELEEANKYEEKIFDCVIGENSSLDEIRKEKNGYYILTILAVLSSFFSIWLSNRLMKRKDQPAQPANKMMYFIMPIIMGIFTSMYTSMFAIYIIVGQLMMIALTPLTTLIVKKWVEADAKKKKEKDVIDVDYRRKDI